MLQASKQLIEPKEIQPEKTVEKAAVPKKVEEIQPVQKVQFPISSGKKISKFSISDALSKNEQEEPPITESKEEELPNQHFTDTDLQTEWADFLRDIRQKDVVIYSAINGFKFSKIDEDTIAVSYPSDTAKSEFDKVQADFFNHFKRKVNHHRIKVEYKMDKALKVEIITKRSLFEKMAEKNPVLKDLDDLFKFDFS